MNRLTVVLLLVHAFVATAIALTSRPATVVIYTVAVVAFLSRAASRAK